MPWLCLLHQNPYKKLIKDLYYVVDIPTFVIINKKG